MALGVLNNLSAIYAENNLNNTNASLQTVLQQLSSGSKLNSGADDAAGLSLVNGLEANQTALMQSETNATEGVGLLDVADGALSQVTSLLDRAITLATEASNGTLNRTQESAANQEYQSILSEVNNIGSTTTYNQQRVFSGQTVSVYTGDSSTAGSSIDDLNIRTLSDASVGDSGGTMSYSSGENNVFLNLSNGSTNAAGGDILNTSGATAIDVTYLVKGSTGAATTATTSIAVGTGTSYANTVDGLISAINNSGLGLTATLGSEQDAGVTGGGYQTGIQIAGGLVAVGGDPGSVSTSGILDATGIASDALLAPGQTITVRVGGQTVGSPITIGANVNTLGEVASAINEWIGAPVKAAVITNGDGTQSLSLTETAGTAGALTVTSTAGTQTAAPAFGTATIATDAPLLNTTSVTGSTLTVGLASGSLNTGDTLATGGSISLTNNGTTQIFTIGTGSAANTTYLAAGSTLADLASAISTSALGVTAQANTTGLNLTSTSPPGGPVTLNSSTLADGTGGTYSTDALGTFAGESDTVAGTLSFSVNGTVESLAVTSGSTIDQMMQQINAAGLGVHASWAPTSNGYGNVLLTADAEGSAGQIGAATASLNDTTPTATLSYTPAAAYGVGLTSDATNVVYDSTTGQNGITNAAGLISDAKTGSGAATMSYSDGAGESLAGTNLLSQSSAQTALTDLNLAISDVAAQDGYIGAQINTLNSVSQVMTTQQENVVSAQNAIQATDYASATSNMSKYEILSQTGIAALAQANSVQQEVTKLLQ